MTISVVFEAGNVSPRIVRITTTSTLAQVTAAGWYSNVAPNQLQPTDEVEIAYAQGSSNAATAFFSVAIAAGVVTLSVAESGVVLPVVSGDFAVFSGTTGAISDLGYLPSNAAKTRVVMANGATIANHIATYADTTGTIGIDAATAINGGNIQAGLSGTAGQLASFPGTAANGSFIFKAINNAGNFNSTLSNSNIGQATVYSLPDPGAATANLILSTSGSAQTIAGGLTISTGNLGVTAGNITAGSSGSAGTVSSFPGTAANGSLILAAINAGGAFTTTISNSAMGQSTVYSMADIGASTGGLVVATAAVRMKSVAQAAVAGGAAAQTVTDTFCTSGSNVICTWNDTTNAVSIQKAVAGNGSFVVTSSADPGASHLNYIIIK